ncbi:MAG TPA: chemotaxis protein CheA [Pseudomonas sp.]|mgnify:FL=1|nr:chemotaxis protein CheA [Pseudomonadales bacterium]HCB44428.1 chemotaxis protein CheA [Pseudomonas sp.]HCL41193.1 chemotaxis protein CheA [Pseudomonas sp.]|tara:strand:- start:779 stop:2581 length:1803 start_codon:yes stop_codon:yes gene_type:complete
MSVELNQFHSVFFEESQEHIDTMERLLMAMSVDNPDAEDLNCIFRAAHSIKGASGIFGFDALGQITHIMENLLDQVRKGQRAVSVDLVDQFLGVIDCLRQVLDSYRNETDIDWPEVERTTSLLESILGTQAEGDVTAVDDGFGFFDEPVAAQAEEDDGFGFFEEPAAIQNQPEEQGWGLFEAAQAEQPAAGKTAASPKDDAQAKKPASSESSTIRVDIEKVDSLINLVGELVITQSMLKVLGDDIGGSNSRMGTVLAELERHTREIQESVMSIRMMPVSFVFNRFPRVVRDLARKLEKEVDLVLEGEHTELDKGLIEKLVDPLTHLVRNSIDHGIERPDVRRDRGKPEKGTITISAAQRGGTIQICIDDDGAGLNRERIMSKARENGLNVSDDMNDADVWDLIFQPGFSTAEVVTDVSGRGVGMDVVRRNIQQLGGRVNIASRALRGSTITITLPLTLAIVDGMGVMVGDQTFIIPLVSIIESMRPYPENIEQLAGSALLHVRDQFWPVLPLYQVMDAEPRHTSPAEGIVVLIETSKRRYGLLVDELVGQQQVVIKSLEQHYKRVPGAAGATIMGDGSVALILDVESLADVAPILDEEIA